MQYRIRHLLELTAWFAIASSLALALGPRGTVTLLPPLVWLRLLVGDLYRRNREGCTILLISAEIGFGLGMLFPEAKNPTEKFILNLSMANKVLMLGVWSGVFVGVVWRLASFKPATNRRS